MQEIFSLAHPLIHPAAHSANRPVNPFPIPLQLVSHTLPLDPFALDALVLFQGRADTMVSPTAGPLRVLFLFPGVLSPPCLVSYSSALLRGAFPNLLESYPNILHSQYIM